MEGYDKTATNNDHDGHNHDNKLCQIYPTTLNEFNCTFGVSFSRFHCCGRHGHGLWPSWYRPVSDRVKSFRLRFFGHLARSAPQEDHHRVTAAASLRPPTDWRRPVGRPRATWLRTIDEDVQPLNFGVHTAWKKARDRDIWQQVVSTATLC